MSKDSNIPEALRGVPVFDNEEEGRAYVARVWEARKKELKEAADRCAAAGGYKHIDEVPQDGRLLFLMTDNLGEITARWAYNSVGLGGWLMEDGHWFNPYFVIGWREIEFA